MTSKVMQVDNLYVSLDLPGSKILALATIPFVMYISIFKSQEKNGHLCQTLGSVQEKAPYLFYAFILL